MWLVCLCLEYCSSKALAFGAVGLTCTGSMHIIGRPNCRESFVEELEHFVAFVKGSSEVHFSARCWVLLRVSQYAGALDATKVQFKVSIGYAACLLMCGVL